MKTNIAIFSLFVVLVLPLLCGCEKTQPVQHDISVPVANKADVAIATVQAYKPPGATRSIADVYARTALLGSSVGVVYKEVGWGATQESKKWKVTHAYINDEGKEVKANWLVSLDPLVISPLDDRAKRVQFQAVHYDMDGATPYKKK